MLIVVFSIVGLVAVVMAAIHLSDTRNVRKRDEQMREHLTREYPGDTYPGRTE